MSSVNLGKLVKNFTENSQKRFNLEVKFLKKNVFYSCKEFEFNVEFPN